MIIKWPAFISWFDSNQVRFQGNTSKPTAIFKRPVIRIIYSTCQHIKYWFLWHEFKVKESCVYNQCYLCKISYIYILCVCVLGPEEWWLFINSVCLKWNISKERSMLRNENRAWIKPKRLKYSQQVNIIANSFTKIHMTVNVLICCGYSNLYIYIYIYIYRERENELKRNSETCWVYQQLLPIDFCYRFLLHLVCVNDIFFDISDICYFFFCIYLFFIFFC